MKVLYARHRRGQVHIAIAPRPARPTRTGQRRADWQLGLALLAMLATGPAAIASEAADAPTRATDAEALAEIERELGGSEVAPATDADVWSRRSGRANLRLIDVALDLIVAAGGSTADPGDIATLNAGGHDPNRNGFTVQNVELTLAGAVDPYFTANASIVLQIDPGGETLLELEEAYARTSALPGGLELKAGMYITEFGRHNSQHPHQWAFVDQPLASTRVLGGDGLRGPGARMSWLLPLPWYVEWLAGVQNANGETAVSFLGSDDAEAIGGYPATGRETGNWRDMIYTARWLNSWTLADAWTLNLGGSGAIGPNASGPDRRTGVAGGDVYLVWKPLTHTRGWPFVRLQGEYLQRWYEAGDGTAPPATLIDRGWYAQLLAGFAERWVGGARVDCVRAKGGLVAPTLDPARDRRRRVAPNLTFYPTEYSRLRLQYNLDLPQALPTAHALWLQAEVSLGAHAAHTF